MSLAYQQGPSEVVDQVRGRVQVENTCLPACSRRDREIKLEALRETLTTNVGHLRSQTHRHPQTTALFIC